MCLRGAVVKCLLFFVLNVFCFKSHLAGRLLCPCDVVTTDVRQENVTFPCRLQDSRDKATVRWSFTGGDGVPIPIATIQSDGTFHSQSEYKGRVMMQNLSINSSDRNLSIVLKQPKKNEMGGYQIKVTTYGNPPGQFDHFIDMVVNDAVVKSVEANESDPNVILPCDATQENANRDCIATWIKLEGGTTGRCVLQRGSDGNNNVCSDAHKDRVSIGDQVSMVLSSPTVGDTGNYSCTIQRGECFRITSYVYLTVIKGPKSSGPKSPGPKPDALVGNEKDTALAVGIPSAIVFLVVATVTLAWFLYRRNLRRTGNDTRSGSEDGEMTQVPLTRPISNGNNNGDCG